eukprot:2974301-Pyramimonas_sp.AAC.1
MKRDLGGRVYFNIVDESWVCTGPPPPPPRPLPPAYPLCLRRGRRCPPPPPPLPPRQHSGLRTAGRSVQALGP